MDEKGLGRRLQALRQAAGLTQQALCQQANLSYSTLTKIERGAIKAPSIFTIQSIATALGLGLDDILQADGASKKRTLQRSKSGVSFVYFDINGCLVRFFHGAFTRLSAETGEPVDVVETIFWHYNDQVCRGELSMADFNKTFAKELGLPKLNWLDYYLEAIEPIPEMHELVTWTAQHYRVGLLTNIMPGFVAVMRERGLLPDVAYDAIIDSSETKAIKPEAAIYEAALKKAGCPAGDILLIDDSRANLMAAEKHGWHVLWFDDYDTVASVERVRTALEPAS